MGQPTLAVLGSFAPPPPPRTEQTFVSSFPVDGPIIGLAWQQNIPESSNLLGYVSLGFEINGARLLTPGQPVPMGPNQALLLCNPYYFASADDFTLAPTYVYLTLLPYVDPGIVTVLGRGNLAVLPSY